MKSINETDVISIPENLIQRIIARKEQLVILNERVMFLNQLNEEAITSFIDGQDIPKDATLTLDDKKWVIVVEKKSKETKKGIIDS